MTNLANTLGRMTVQAAILALGIAAAQAQVVTIDDFSTGPYRKALGIGQDTNTQTGSMAGGSRQTLFSTCGAPPCSDPFGEPSFFQVRPSSRANVPSALIVTAGYYMGPGVSLTYGLSAPLDLDVTSGGANDRFRLTFHGANTPLRVDFVVRSGVNFVDRDCAIPYTGLAAYTFTVDFPFSAFANNGVDFQHLDLIQLLGLGGDGTVDGDFALTHIQAVPPSAGTFTCPNN